MHLFRNAKGLELNSLMDEWRRRLAWTNQDLLSLICALFQLLPFFPFRYFGII